MQPNSTTNVTKRATSNLGTFCRVYSPLGSFWKFSGRYEVRFNPLCRCGKPHIFKIYVSPDGAEWPLMQAPGTPLPYPKEGDE